MQVKMYYKSAIDLNSNERQLKCGQATGLKDEMQNPVWFIITICCKILSILLRDPFLLWRK